MKKRLAAVLSPAPPPVRRTAALPPGLTGVTWLLGPKANNKKRPSRKKRHRAGRKGNLVYVATISRNAVQVYLREFAVAAFEIARSPALLHTFIRLLRIELPTLLALSAECPAPRVRGPWLRRVAASR